MGRGEARRMQMCQRAEVECNCVQVFWCSGVLVFGYFVLSHPVFAYNLRESARSAGETGL